MCPQLNFILPYQSFINGNQSRLGVARPVQKIHQVKNSLHFKDAVFEVLPGRSDHRFFNNPEGSLFPDFFDDIVILKNYMVFAKSIYRNEVVFSYKQALVAIPECIYIKPGKPAICV